MNRVLIVIVGLISVSIMLTSCSRTKTYSGPGGKVTVTPEKGGKTVKVESKDGSYEWTGDQNRSISEAELGIPVYPGAKVMMEGDWKGGEAQQSPDVKQHILYSTDSFEKVSAFYKSKLKNVKNEQSFSSGDNKMYMFTVGDDEEMMVHISWDTGEKQTMIQVMKQAKR